MRPHRLRVTAFGAFAATEQVVFDDLEGLFLLHGETGAGKTTLLDAIAFALYGRVPGERGTARRLRSDHASPGTATEVELEATIGGRRLRVTRRPEQVRQKKSGPGTTTEPASVRLAEFSPAGDWESKSTRIGEVDVEIENLMGMSAAQFFQVVLLPQGEFAKFLRADAKDKEALLQKLFGTDRFRKVEDWLAERRRVTEKEVTAAEDVVNQLVARIAQAAGTSVPNSAAVLNSPEFTEPLAALAGSGHPVGSCAAAPSGGSLPGRSGSAEPLAALAGSGYLTASAAAAASGAPVVGRSASDGSPLDQADGGAASRAWQATWAAALAAMAAAERAAGAALVDLRKASLAASLAAQRQAEQLADRQRRRRDALDRKADLEAVTPEIAQVRAAAEHLRDTAGAVTVSAGGSTALPVASEHPYGAAGALTAPVAESTALHAAAREQQAQVGRLEALRAVARQADAEDETAVTARFRVAALSDDLDRAQAEARQRQAARPSAEQARDAASQAAAALPAARATAQAARQIAGDCAALVAEHAKRGELHEAHLTAREAAVTAQEAAFRVREARIDGMRAELAAQMTDGSPCPVCGSLEHPDPVDSSSFPPVGRDEEETAFRLVSDATQAADEAGSRVAAVDAVLSDLVQRLTDVGFTFSAATAETSDPTTMNTEVSNTPASNAGDVGAAALTAPASTARPSGAGPSGPAAPRPGTMNTATLAAAAGAAAADAVACETEAARLADAAACVTSLQRELDELDTAMADDKIRLAGLTEQRTAALAEAEAADARAAARRAELAVGLGDADDLEEAISAATRLAEALLQAAAVADLLTDPDLDVRLDPPAPVEETAQAAKAAQQSHDDANTAYGQARHRAEQLTALRPQLDQALDALNPLRERAGQIRHLADLANGTSGANHYKMTLSSFVLAARLEEVAAAASERLLAMTAGRYSLVHSDARKGNAKAGLSLLACDAWTGIDRDTATLSGGETFLASLALALGLADVVTAESAGTRMEALFVDEGFGTLDEDTLDEVMNVLDGLRAGGRIVGIVSHVTELRQRIPARVHVRKSRTGSHVEVAPG
jgi:DNA repair protein SbcC/Rad50